jgi:hypothetical protein
MTPDEVVGVLKVFREGWVPYTKGAKYPVEHQALTTAITLIQDYQKLREKIDADKIRGVMGINCESYPADEYKMANAIVTYLGGGE